MSKVFAGQITKHGNLVRFKVAGHPTVEGFGQFYNFTDGKYAGRIKSVNNDGIAYRVYLVSLDTGRLFNLIEEAADYLSQDRTVRQ